MLFYRFTNDWIQIYYTTYPSLIFYKIYVFFSYEKHFPFNVSFVFPLQLFPFRFFFFFFFCKFLKVLYFSSWPSKNLLTLQECIQKVFTSTQKIADWEKRGRVFKCHITKMRGGRKLNSSIPCNKVMFELHHFFQFS